MATSIRSSMEQLTRLLEECLEREGSVSVDGLGVFARTPSGELQFTPRTTPRIFLAYVQEDLAGVQRLAGGLRARGCDPWLDRERLLPGQNWPRAIECAIECSDFFLPLFSRNSVRKRSQFQAEIRFALECANRHPLDSAFVIPVRLDDCAVPKRIAGSIQYVDLFPDWDNGVAEIAAAIRANRPNG